MLRRGLLLLPMAVALAGCAQGPTRAGPGGDEALVRRDLLDALARSADAWNRGDLKGHLAIYDESVTVMTKAGPRPGVAPIEASFAAAYFKDGRPRQALAIAEVQLRLLSVDAALMTGRFTLSGGGEPTQSGWFTLVWIRTSAGWKAVHDHTG